MILSSDWAEVVREVAGRMPAVLAVVTFRAVPIVLYVLYKSRSLARRALVVSLFGLAVLGIHRAGIPIAELVVGAPLANAYFALLALLAHRAPPLIRRRVLTKAATFGLLLMAFLVVPALVVPEPYVLTSLIVSWEVMLGAYSYCVDVAASKEAVTAREAVFFIVVNPVLVYAERGESGLDRGRWKGALRLGLGALALVLQDVILVALPSRGGQPFDLTAVRSVDAYAHFMGAYLGLFAGLYAAHSGLASIQIGLLRLIGFSIPERYTFPGFATSPADFWRRWNRWVGSWVRRYLFAPLAWKWTRRDNRRARSLILLSTLVAFAGVGLLHDLPKTLAQLHRPQAAAFPMTFLFVLIGAIFVAWEIGSRLKVVAWLLRPRRWFSRALAWVVFVHVVCVTMWVAHPAMGARKLPGPFGRLLNQARGDGR